MKAVIINGGNSMTSRLTGIENEIKANLQAVGIAFNVIQVHQLPADDLITANYASDEIINHLSLVSEAEIIFVLTPIYKGSYSGILKTFLDLLPQKGLQNKIVIPVAIGGSIAHLLALEYSLKPVLSILGATTISSPIYIVDKQVQKLANGQFSLDVEAKDRIKSVWEAIYGSK
ncbi:NADPH-dependent FMN reductase [Bacillus aquiflavi]|uniref:NADPH-dependent FMN reductase n=1 Tax=Bacillus aquiflavi TaxID=2672567 RepID=A0A6B3W406_9BACI|nr:NADPH-dependent FMN reductase [Bacillus aquiflavi]MBA4538272.1 NADPH-dependent FMN reductase [Bacillus aquiflavi]NEY82591.1 NADPH-dependent FMN reductase [Bacillus aquiflavi]UAC48151.1 NADPH-dependent FMN reductase [Bacillus aquiflavi]